MKLLGPGFRHLLAAVFSSSIAKQSDNLSAQRCRQ